MSKLSNPYNYSILSDEIVFKTDLGINYSCLFVLDEATNHLGLNVESEVYHFLFFTENAGKDLLQKNDDRIHLTIVEILKDFFLKNPEGIIIYFCDDKDAKGKARHNLFTQWVKRYNSPPRKTLVNLSVDDSGLHISLLLLENHKERKALKVALQQQISELVENDKPHRSSIE